MSYFLYNLSQSRWFCLCYYYPVFDKNSAIKGANPLVFGLENNIKIEKHNSLSI